MENVKLCRGKSYPTRSANPKLSRGDFFLAQKPSWVLQRDPELYRIHEYIVSSAFAFHQLVILPTYPFIAGTSNE